MICISFIIGMIVLLLCNIWAFIDFKKQTKKALEEHDEEKLKDIGRRKKWVKYITATSVIFCTFQAIVYTLFS